MRLLILIVIVLIASCTSNYQPELNGKMITLDWNSNKITIDLTGIINTYQLQSRDSVYFSNPVWLKHSDMFLMCTEKNEGKCFTSSIISYTSDERILDTIYKANLCENIDFMPSPDDSLIAMRVFRFMDGIGTCTYLVYNLNKRKAIDSIKFTCTNLVFSDFYHETTWSPDSKKFLIFKKLGKLDYAMTYDLTSKNIVPVDSGTNFIWSPINSNVISYLKNNSIWFKDIQTGKATKFFSSKSIHDFRWNPSGDFLVINKTEYFLGIESIWTTSLKHILISTLNSKNRSEANDYLIIDSWK
jgi:hypothetical protein